MSGFRPNAWRPAIVTLMLRDVRISNRFRFNMDKDALELPLFPLNVVLFPGQTLPLHVFEPRYRLMINRCIERGEPFGVVLARDDDPDSPYEIGTAARITQAERLDDLDDHDAERHTIVPEQLQTPFNPSVHQPAPLAIPLRAGL